MSKKIELSIPEPCHEDWDKMSPTAQGRFCGSCQKQVIDFSNMSDSQLIAFFKNKASGSVCGSFMPDQLDRSMDIPKKRIPWVRYFFQFTLPIFFGVMKARAQGGVLIRKSTKTETRTQMDSSDEADNPKLGKIRKDIRPVEQLLPKGNITMQEVSKEMNAKSIPPPIPVCGINPPMVMAQATDTEITGHIIDEDGKPIPYASVMIKGTDIGISADQKGLFILQFPKETGSLVLIASSVGYESREMDLTNPETKLMYDEIYVALKMKSMQDVTVVSYQSNIRGMIVGGIRSKKTSRKEIKVIQEPESLKNTVMQLYPNPLPAGAAINIKCDKMEESYYTFQVFTINGQQVYSKEIWIDKEARVLNVPMPSVKPGMYMVVMTNKEGGKKFTEKVVIQ